MPHLCGENGESTEEWILLEGENEAYQRLYLATWLLAGSGGAPKSIDCSHRGRVKKTGSLVFIDDGARISAISDDS